MVRGSGFRVSGSQLTMIADAEKIHRILWKGSGRQVFFPSFALSMFVTLLIFSVRIVKYLISWILIKFFNTKNNFSWRHKLAIQRLQIDIVKGRTYYICHIAKFQCWHFLKLRYSRWCCRLRFRLCCRFLNLEGKKIFKNTIKYLWTFRYVRNMDNGWFEIIDYLR